MSTATAVRTGTLGLTCALLTVIAHDNAGGQAPGALALAAIIVTCTVLASLVSRRRWVLSNVVLLLGGCQVASHAVLEALSTPGGAASHHGISSALTLHPSTGTPSSMVFAHGVVALASAGLLCHAERAAELAHTIVMWAGTALARLMLRPVLPVSSLLRRPMAVGTSSDVRAFGVYLVYDLCRRGPPCSPAPEPLG